MFYFVLLLPFGCSQVVIVVVVVVFFIKQTTLQVLVNVVVVVVSIVLIGSLLNWAQRQSRVQARPGQARALLRPLCFCLCLCFSFVCLCVLRRLLLATICSCSSSSRPDCVCCCHLYCVKIVYDLPLCVCVCLFSSPRLPLSSSSACLWPDEHAISTTTPKLVVATAGGRGVPRGGRGKWKGRGRGHLGLIIISAASQLSVSH